jgi:hypothetical protein
VSLTVENEDGHGEKESIAQQQHDVTRTHRDGIIARIEVHDGQTRRPVELLPGQRDAEETGQKRNITRE